MKFENLENTKPKSNIDKVAETTVINIGNVSIELVKDPDEDFNTITDLTSLLALDIKKPGLIKKITPPLYPSFQSAVNKTINPYVSIGDSVRYTRKEAVPDGSSIEATYTVTDIEISSLMKQSVITARLNNGDLCLSFYLKKV